MWCTWSVQMKSSKLKMIWSCHRWPTWRAWSLTSSQISMSTRGVTTSRPSSGKVWCLLTNFSWKVSHHKTSSLTWTRLIRRWRMWESWEPPSNSKIRRSRSWQRKCKRPNRSTSSWWNNIRRRQTISPFWEKSQTSWSRHWRNRTVVLSEGSTTWFRRRRSWRSWTWKTRSTRPSSSCDLFRKVKTPKAFVNEWASLGQENLHRNQTLEPLFNQEKDL